MQTVKCGGEVYRARSEARVLMHGWGPYTGSGRLMGDYCAFRAGMVRIVPVSDVGGVQGCWSEVEHGMGPDTRTATGMCLSLARLHIWLTLSWVLICHRGGASAPHHPAWYQGRKPPTTHHMEGTLTYQHCLSPSPCVPDASPGAGLVFLTLALVLALSTLCSHCDHTCRAAEPGRGLFFCCSLFACWGNVRVGDRVRVSATIRFYPEMTTSGFEPGGKDSARVCDGWHVWPTSLLLECTIVLDQPRCFAIAIGYGYG